MIAIAIEQVTSERYGPAALALQDIIRRLHQFTWFPTHQGKAAVEGYTALAREHLALLGLAEPSSVAHASADIRWVTGDLTVFDQGAHGRYDPEIWGDPWREDPWGSLLAAIEARCEATIEASPVLLSAIQPPIWPKTGRVNIVQSLVYEAPPKLELRGDARWSMLAHVEFNIWHLLAWAVAHNGQIRQSPFYPLFELHRVGCYPLGLADGAFEVYARTAPDAG